MAANRDCELPLRLLPLLNLQEEGVVLAMFWQELRREAHLCVTLPSPRGRSSGCAFGAGYRDGQHREASTCRRYSTTCASRQAKEPPVAR